MEWKIYLRYQEKAYRILKLRQGANFDITIVPRNAVLFSRDVIKNLVIGDQIQLDYESLAGGIDHYSAHARTGQRHVKLEPGSPALEPTIGVSFINIDKPIPLITIVAGANSNSLEEPSSGKWFGYELPDDVNYLIMELIAVPKDFILDAQLNLGTIHNVKKTRETFDTKTIEMRNCTVVTFTRWTNNELTDIPNNVVFQQVEGKSIAISRVEKGAVLATVMQLVAQ
jgi:hypothetical protein